VPGKDLIDGLPEAERAVADGTAPADQYKHAFGALFHAHLQVDPVRPDVDVRRAERSPFRHEAIEARSLPRAPAIAGQRSVPSHTTTAFEQAHERPNRDRLSRAA
jgi:hypothetical protein